MHVNAKYILPLERLVNYTKMFPLHDTLHMVTDTSITMKVNLLRFCLLCMVDIEW